MRPSNSRIRTLARFAVAAVLLGAFTGVVPVATGTATLAVAGDTSQQEGWHLLSVGEPYATWGPKKSCGVVSSPQVKTPITCTRTESFSNTVSGELQVSYSVVSASVGYQASTAVSETFGIGPGHYIPKGYAGTVNYRAKYLTRQLTQVHYVCESRNSYGLCNSTHKDKTAYATSSEYRYNKMWINQWPLGARRVAPSGPGVIGGWESVYQSDDGTATTYGTVDQYDWQAGMAAGTSPAIASLGANGYEIALQTNTTDLWLLGDAGNIDTGLGMMPGTSPAIAALGNGGYEVAFQANTGSLWTYGSAGLRNWGAGMAAGTSPSITGIGTSGYEVAIQANTGELWTLGTLETKAWALGMMAGTSPSITTVAGGYEIAFQANTSSLWTVGAAGWKDWNTGMDTKSSPSITAATGGYEVALQINSHNLWTLGTVEYKDWGLGMMPGTSPAIGSVSGGGSAYEVGFQANDGTLWNVGAAGSGGSFQPMAPGTSPGQTRS